MAKELKNEIKYGIQFCEEQKEAKRLILDNEIVIITGNPGTGKSSLVAATMLDLIFKKIVNKVTLERPTVEVGSSLGFLPGDLETKVSPYLQAFRDSMEKCYPHPEKISKLFEEGKVVTDALQFIRGTNVEEGRALILEEAQNCTPKEMEAVMTRASGGKIVILGDLRQCDISGRSGLEFAIELSKNIEGIKHIHLKENHRSGIVKEIIDYIYGIEK